MDRFGQGGCWVTTAAAAGRTEERKLSTLVYVVDGGGIGNEINKSTFVIQINFKQMEMILVSSETFG